MADRRTRTLSELIADNDLMTAAIRQGVREELLAHARAGISVPVSENGKIVWWPPDEIFRRLGQSPATSVNAP